MVSLHSFVYCNVLVYFMSKGGLHVKVLYKVGDMVWLLFFQPDEQRKREANKKEGKDP